MAMDVDKRSNVVASNSRKRAFTPKSRGGCMTCKARRVKCDEEKPACKRCKDWGTECSGYRNVTKASERRALLPKASDSILTPVAEMAIHIQPYSDLEYHYIRLYQNAVSHWLEGPIYSNLWDIVMLQGAQEEKFIKHAIIAITVLSTLENSNSLPRKRLVAFSLSQYAKAITGMRESLSNSWDSTRKALIACLLVSCYENLSGRYVSAMTHARGGCRLMRDWIMVQPPSSRGRGCLGSPAPDTIEDSIVQAFFRLNMQDIIENDQRPSGIQAELKNEATSILENMPEMFFNLKEASQYLTLLEARTSQYLHDLNYWSQLNKPDHEYEKPSMEGALIKPDAEYVSLQAEAGERLLQFKRWNDAFRLVRKKNSQDPRPIVEAEVLYIHWITARASLIKATTHRSESVVDPLLEGHRLLVKTARSEIELLHMVLPGLPIALATPYTNDFGIIPHLHKVARFCRDHLVRREAIALLRRVFWREGVWCSQKTADFDEQLLQIEESGIERAEKEVVYEIPQEAMIASITIPNGQEKISSMICSRGRGFECQRIHFPPGQEIEIAIVVASSALILYI